MPKANQNTAAKKARGLELDEWIIGARRVLANLMETTWLAGLLLTPLVFSSRNFFFHLTEPKQNVVHLTALILVSLWVFDAALNLALNYNKRPLIASCLGWFKGAWRDPYKLALIFGALYLIGNLFTFALSPLSAVSFLGRNSNEPGDDFYTIAAAAAIFLTLATKIRNLKQVERILWVATIAGFLSAGYGALQLIGWDPFSFLDTDNRIASTFSNPLFFASYMIFAIFSALILGVLNWRRGAAANVRIAAVLLISIVLMMSVIFTTGSRGPFIALVAGLSVFISLVSIASGGFGRRVRAALMLALAIFGWLAITIAGGEASEPILIGAYVVVALGATAIFGFEWLQRREKVVHTATFGAATLAIFTLIFFALSSAGTILVLYYMVLPTAAYALFAITAKRDEDWGARVGGAKSAKKNRRRAGASETRRRVWDGVKPYLLDARFVLVFAATAGLFVSFAIAGAEGADRIDAELNLQAVDAVEGSLIGGDAALTSDELAQDSALFNSIDSFLNGRLGIWNGGAEVAVSRPSLFDDGAASRFWRHIFGQGQNMYYLVSSLTLPPSVAFELASHAHNQFLQIWIEQGLWGIVSYLGLIGALAFALAAIFRRALRKSDKREIILACGLTALLSSLLINYISNLGRVSDNVTLWAFFAVIIAVYQMRGRVDASETADYQPSQSASKKPKKRSSVGAVLGYGRRFWAPVASFVVVSVLSAYMFVSYDAAVLYQSAGAVNAFGQITLSSTVAENQPHLDRIKAASAANPSNEVYALEHSNIVDAYNDRLGQFNVALIEEKVTVLQNHLDASPFSILALSRLISGKLALIALDAPRYQNDEFINGLRQDIDDFNFVTGEAYPIVKGRTAFRLLSVASLTAAAAQERELNERAFQIADEALAVARSENFANRTVGETLYTRGLALERLERYEDSIMAFEEWFVSNPNDRNYILLSIQSVVKSLNELEDTERAEKYEALEPLAMRFHDAERGEFWVRDLYAGQLVKLAGGELDSAIAASNRYVSRHPNYEPYDEYTAQVMRQLAEFAMEVGQPESVSECYSDNAERVEAFIDAGSAGKRPELTICLP